MEFFQDYFTFDSKFIRTLRPLLFTPGKLTEEFSSGRLANYVPPVRLYVFASLVYFFLLGMSFFESDNHELSFAYNIGSVFDEEQIKLDPILTESENNKVAGNWLKEILKGQREYSKMPFAIQKSIVLKSISILMFCLVPLMSFLFYFLYRRRRQYYVESLVFSFHVHTFLIISSILHFFIKVFIMNISPLLIYLLFLIYLFLAIKRFYGSSRRRLIFSMLLFVPSYSILLLLGIVIIWIYTMTQAF